MNCFVPLLMAVFGVCAFGAQAQQPSATADNDSQQVSSVSLETDSDDPVPETDAPILRRRWRADPDKFTFAILGDRTGADYRSWQIFDRSIEEINLSRPDFVVMVGDMIEGNAEPDAVTAQWGEFVRHVDLLESPFMYLPGNHDVGTPAGAEYWKQHLGRTYTSFVYKKSLFLLLNTEEVQESAGNSFGATQMEYALNRLDSSASMRHTFIFMHQPAWAMPSLRAEWERIEQALGDRPYTVFAGHTHTLSMTVRDGRRYFALGATGGVLDENPIEETGAFHHYTLVTMARDLSGRDSAYVSIRQPGNVWRENISTGAFYRDAARMVRIAAIDAKGWNTPSVEITIAASVQNPFGEPATAALGVSGLKRDGWRLLAGDTTRAVILPGQTLKRTLRFAAPQATLLPVPTIAVRRQYRGTPLATVYQPVPLAPDSLFRPIGEWNVAGVFSPDADSATFHALTNGLPLTSSPSTARVDWRRAEADEGFLSVDRLFGQRVNSVAYATCAIYSPHARITAARVWANDSADVFVNGTRVNERPFTLDSGETEYAALSLRAGWNKVVVRTGNATGRWTLLVRVADLAGDLRFAPQRP
jgi:hypothetical protein